MNTMQNQTKNNRIISNNNSKSEKFIDKNNRQNNSRKLCKTNKYFIQ